MVTCDDDAFVLLTRGLGLFMEAMQNVYRFFKFSDIHDAIGATAVFDADLFRADAHFIEWLPVGRLQPGLNLP